MLRAIGYDLGPDGKITNGDVVAGKLTEMLTAAKKQGVDSPVFTLVEGLGEPDIKRLKTDVFRDRVSMRRCEEEAGGCEVKKGPTPWGAGV